MHEWETIYRYLQYDPRTYESPARLQPGDEHVAVYCEVMPGGPELRRTGLWYVSRPEDAALPDQGWKLHVAVATRHSVEALRRACRVLGDEGAAFKFLVDQRAIGLVNSKLWDRASGGKFITVYPADVPAFRRIGAALAEALEGLEGPRILSDRPWPGSRSLHYRYGGFTARSRLEVDGTRTLMIAGPDGELVPDRRRQYWEPPPWAVDPFPTGQRPSQEEVPLGGGRFAARTALRYSNRGGVYRALDRET